jgi:hypothetical protein
MAYRDSTHRPSVEPWGDARATPPKHHAPTRTRPSAPCSRLRRSAHRARSTIRRCSLVPSAGSTPRSRNRHSVIRWMPTDRTARGSSPLVKDHALEVRILGAQKLPVTLPAARRARHVRMRRPIHAWKPDPAAGTHHCCVAARHIRSLAGSDLHLRAGKRIGRVGRSFTGRSRNRGVAANGARPGQGIPPWPACEPRRASVRRSPPGRRTASRSSAAGAGG